VRGSRSALQRSNVARLSKAEIEGSRLTKKTHRVEVSQETFDSPLEPERSRDRRPQAARRVSAANQRQATTRPPVARLSKAEIEGSRLTKKAERAEVTQGPLVSPLEPERSRDRRPQAARRVSAANQRQATTRPKPRSSISWLSNITPSVLNDVLGHASRLWRVKLQRVFTSLAIQLHGDSSPYRKGFRLA
jgi:hypothetical protein